MLKVQKFIHDNGLDLLSEHPYFIDVNKYNDSGLIVLNYSLLNSDKHDPIVKECRGLILDTKNNYSVVARSFDRFHNYKECPLVKNYNIGDAYVLEKIDGSLMTAYYHNNKWNISTRRRAFAEGEAGLSNYTFREIFEKTFDLHKLNQYRKDLNFVFELTSPETRIVTQYTEYKSYLLTIRNRKTGEELSNIHINLIALDLQIDRPKMFKMTLYSDIVTALRQLHPLNEGYVCLWEDNDSKSHYRVKIKNPSYLAIAHLRENGVISEKRVILLTVSGDEKEYLIYFPEDRKIFQPYIDVFNKIKDDINSLWNKNKDIEDKKEFAFKIKDHPVGLILFQLRKGRSLDDIFYKLTENSKIKLFEEYGCIINN